MARLETRTRFSSTPTTYRQKAAGPPRMRTLTKRIATMTTVSPPMRPTWRSFYGYMSYFTIHETYRGWRKGKYDGENIMWATIVKRRAWRRLLMSRFWPWAGAGLRQWAGAGAAQRSGARCLVLGRPWLGRLWQLGPGVQSTGESNGKFWARLDLS
jgi:hypothetical protein